MQRIDSNQLSGSCKLYLYFRQTARALAPIALLFAAGVIPKSFAFAAAAAGGAGSSLQNHFNKVVENSKYDGENDKPCKHNRFYFVGDLGNFPNLLKYA